MLKEQAFTSLGAGGWKSKTTALAGLVSPEAPPLGSQGVLTWSFLRTRGPVASLRVHFRLLRRTQSLGLQPTLLASF